jgi:ribosome-binding factor A
MSVKIERLNDQFQKEISMILSTEIKDRDIKFVTITGCEITNDLSFCKVYFTVLDSSKKETTLKALKKASSFIRGMLSQRIEVRHTPELRFIFDESIEYGNKIEKIIEKINEE